MFCKICGKHLYEKIEFYNLFRWDYEIHEKCLLYLEFEVIEDVIPMQNIMVNFMYIFDKKMELNDEYLLIKYGTKLYEKIVEYEHWSIIFFDDSGVFEMMDSVSLFLLLSLCEKDLIVISLYGEV